MIAPMNLPEILAIGLPTLTVLVGILLNRNDYNRLDGRISSLEGRIAGEINGVRSEISKLRDEVTAIRSDQREFYRSLGQHEIRLDNLEKK